MHETVPPVNFPVIESMGRAGEASIAYQDKGLTP